MSNKSICLLDYGSGNVKSVYNILNFLGYDVKISNNSRDIIDRTHIILPGVGAFGSSINKIMDKIPFDVLENEVINRGKPFLGICVGMQVLADKGYEFGEHRGFGWINGVVKKINSEDLPSIHIGWNDLIIKKQSPLLKDIDIINDFYFVHSYIFDVKSDSSTLAQTNYGENFTSVLSKDNIYGVQFHPEKSQKAGKLIFKNFMDIV